MNLVTDIARPELPAGAELTVSGERLRWRAPRGVVAADVGEAGQDLIWRLRSNTG